jgi:hypothetical protein
MDVEVDNFNFISTEIHHLPEISVVNHLGNKVESVLRHICEVIIKAVFCGSCMLNPVILVLKSISNTAPPHKP